MPENRVAEFFANNDWYDPWSGGQVPTEGFEFNDHGWFSDSNQEQLDRLFEDRALAGRPIDTVIELGSWLGRSTRFFAQRAKLVIAVDHWRGSNEHRGRKEFRHILPRLYQQFLFNCQRHSHVIAPVKLDTSIACRMPGMPRADLIYVDASHEYECVCGDLASYEHRLAEGGVLCGDDWLWGGDKSPVARAVRDFARCRARSVYVNGNFWWLGERGSAA